MKLLINATVIQSEGGVTLLKALLSAFQTVMPEGSGIILYVNPAIADRVAVHPNLEIVPFHPGNGLYRFFWEQCVLPGLLKKHQADQLLSFGNTGPLLPSVPQTLYVHQSIPYTRYTPPHQQLKWRLYQLVYGALMGIAQLGSRRIIVPTHWLVAPMRQSVLGLVPLSRYVVSPPGLPHTDAAGELSDRERELLARAQICKSADTPILFYPAYLAPYKNMPYLLTAFSKLLETMEAKLWLTFDRESPEYFPCKKEIFNTFDQAGLSDTDVVFCGSLSRAAMTKLYSLCDAVLFPSLVETLGLPLQEALAFRLPVIACDTPFAREICGEAALFAPPDDPLAFADLMKQCLSDPARREALVEQAQTQAGRFSWERHAREILGL